MQRHSGRISELQGTKSQDQENKKHWSGHLDQEKLTKNQHWTQEAKPISDCLDARTCENCPSWVASATSLVQPAAATWQNGANLSTRSWPYSWWIRNDSDHFISRSTHSKAQSHWMRYDMIGCGRIWWNHKLHDTCFQVIRATIRK